MRDKIGLEHFSLDSWSGSTNCKPELSLRGLGAYPWDVFGTLTSNHWSPIFTDLLEKLQAMKQQVQI